MPLATLHLLRLTKDTTASSFLNLLQKDTKLEIALASIPQFHVIRPQKLDSSILNQNWDLLVLLLNGDKSSKEPPNLRHYSKHIEQAYSLPVGIPTRILADYPARNASLQGNVKHANAHLTGSLEAAERATKSSSSSQNLELSPDLLSFMHDFTQRYGRDQPVTMLNLLHFDPEGGKARYAAYGRAFVEVAGRRGGDAKIVGNVVVLPGVVDSAGAEAGGKVDARAGRKEGEWWNEISLVHYPSIRAFCDMLAGEDYQVINQKHRLGALKDTVLICTKEIALDKARL